MPEVNTVELRVNDITLYYEIAGEGRPLLLLHGNGEDHTIFDTAVPILKPFFRVYAIDSRGHGKSPYTGELHYADMAEDIREFLEQLDLNDAAVYGFSDGGIIGLLAAMDNPRITNLITSGANTAPETVADGLRFLIRVMYRVTGDPKLRMMLKEPHITAEMLSRVSARTLVLAGSKDLVKEADTRFIAASVPDSDLRILASEGHGSYIVHNRRIADILIGCLL